MKNASSTPSSAEATGRELAKAISGNDPNALDGPRKVDGSANATGRKLAQAIPSGTPAAADSQQLDDKRARIAQRAYAKAEQRGFAPGGETDDWLAAERELEPPR